jgi:hypothetical protein
MLSTVNNSTLWNAPERSDSLAFIYPDNTDKEVAANRRDSSISKVLWGLSFIGSLTDSRQCPTTNGRTPVLSADSRIL